MVFVASIALKEPPGTQRNLQTVADIPNSETARTVVPSGEGTTDYLLAHQIYSPNNMLIGAAPFIRIISEMRSEDAIFCPPSGIAQGCFTRGEYLR